MFFLYCFSDNSVSNSAFSVEDNRYISSIFPSLQRKDASGKSIRVTNIDKVNQFIREQKVLVARDEDSEEEKAKKTSAVKYLKNQLNNFSLTVANEMALQVEQANGWQKLNWGKIGNVVKKKFQLLCAFLYRIAMAWIFVLKLMIMKGPSVVSVNLHYL